MRRYIARNRKKLIDQRNENSLTHLLKNKELTLEEKHKLIADRNPFIHAFGERLRAWKGWEDYTDNINKLYLGLGNANNKAVSKTK